MTASAARQRQIRDSKLAARNQKAIDSFRHFAYFAWNTVEPGRLLKWNWHLSLLCDELQDWTRPLWDPGSPPTEPEMVICEPPRSLKSYLVSVCLPAWLWLPAPQIEVMSISYDEDLSERDNLRSLQLMQGLWYQGLVRHKHITEGGDPDGPLPWGFDPRQAAKVNYRNTMAGGRQAFGTKSGTIGRGADLQSIDDPLDVQNATTGSPQQVQRRMNEAWTKYNEVWMPRLNDPTESKRLTTMQRLDPNDPAGRLIRKGQERGGVRVVVLPIEYDPDFPPELGGVHPRDPRTERGQMLMPNRWTPEWWKDVLAEEGSERQAQAQYNQRPKPKSGGLFKPEMFARRFRGDPRDMRLDDLRIFVDCAFKDNADNSFVVFQAIGRIGDARFLVLDQIRDHLSFVDTVRTLIDFRNLWIPRIRGVVVEDKANGPAVVSALKKDIPGIEEWNPGTKSKYERAEVGSVPPMRAGQVEYPEDEWAPWLPGYIERHVAFDGRGSMPDDEIDTTSMGLLYYTGGGEDPLEKLKRRHKRQADRLGQR